LYRIVQEVQRRRTKKVGPQFVEEPNPPWYWIARLLDIFLVLFLWVFVVAALTDEGFRNLLFSPLTPTLVWTREPNNAGAAQAFTAFLQVVATIILLALTWHSISASRQMADSAQKQARSEADRSRQYEMQSRSERQYQARLATLPVITFRDPRDRVGPFAEIILTVANVGMGPAAFATIELSDLVMPYTMDREGEAITLLSGESFDIHLASEFDKNRYHLVAAQEADERGWVPLARITARYQDVRGEIYDNGVTLMWDDPNEVVRLGRPSHDFPLGI
jgi:hypothetical protein